MQNSRNHSILIKCECVHPLVMKAKMAMGDLQDLAEIVMSHYYYIKESKFKK
jgi:hypothetical protein